jgi:hypothetical protein
VYAPNEPLAFNKAHEEASRYLAALALAVGIQKYRFYPSVANNLPKAGGLDTRDRGSTGIATATVYQSERLHIGDVAHARTLLELGGKDKVFERAFGFLQAAWQLRDVPLADPAIHKAILSNCFFVLEAVSDAVTKEWRKKNKKDIFSQQELAIDDLRQNLNDNKGASKKVKAVKVAYRELQRAERYFQDLKLETAGHILGVEDKFISLARELNNLRNTRLMHAGSTGMKELETWIYKSDDLRLLGDPGHFGKGELTAMAYLRAYVAYVPSP